MNEQDLILALCREAGDYILNPEWAEDEFRSNHNSEDITAAATGDVAALVRLRTACGLPLLS